jgi:hypothetical protein
MLETFKKSMTVCAAVTAFSSAGVVALNGVSSMLESKVNTVLTSKSVPLESPSESVVGAVLNSARSVAKSLVK